MPSATLTNVLILLAGVALVWGLLRAAGPRVVFAVRIVDGAPQVASGKVTAAFLDRIREVAAANGISQGNVSGHAHGKHIRLRFSAEFGEAARQQLRNWWVEFGWGAAGSGYRLFSGKQE